MAQQRVDWVHPDAFVYNPDGGLRGDRFCRSTGMLRLSWESFRHGRFKRVGFSVVQKRSKTWEGMYYYVWISWHHVITYRDLARVEQKLKLRWMYSVFPYLKRESVHEVAGFISCHLTCAKEPVEESALPRLRSINTCRSWYSCADTAWDRKSFVVSKGIRPRSMR